MFVKATFKASLVLISLALLVLLAGCAAKTESLGDTEKGMILRYQMPEDQALKYNLSTGMVQKLEVQGNKIEVKTNENAMFSIKPKGLKEENHLLEVNIESMSLNIVTPQGEVSPDMSNVNGKTFEMSLSSLGKESDFSGAESIQYEVTPGSKRSVLTNFQALFPDLPEEPVKIGDTWTTKDAISEKSDTEEVLIEYESVNKLEGFETIEGLECAKITASVTGTFKANAKSQGVEVDSEGKVEGTDTWYFAYKNGLFVKMVSEIIINGSLKTSIPNNPEIPMTHEHKVEITLVK